MRTLKLSFTQLIRWNFFFFYKRFMQQNGMRPWLEDYGHQKIGMATELAILHLTLYTYRCQVLLTWSL